MAHILNTPFKAGSGLNSPPLVLLVCVVLSLLQHFATQISVAEPVMFWLGLWIAALVLACSFWAENLARLRGYNRIFWMWAGGIFGPFTWLGLIEHPDLEARKHQQNIVAELSLIKDDFIAVYRRKK